MIQIKLTRLYNKPHYEVYKDGKKEREIYGYEQAREIYVSAKQRGEKVELDDSVLEEHSKLIELIKSENKKEKKK